MIKRPFNLTDEEFEKRMKVARARAEWEIGDPAWAGVIISAFLYPEQDEEALQKEMEYYDGHV